MKIYKIIVARSTEAGRRAVAYAREELAKVSGKC